MVNKGRLKAKLQKLLNYKWAKSVKPKFNKYGDTEVKIYIANRIDFTVTHRN